ncbi:hypothetical protein MANES_16G117801v8 [Manihot esculenta]|uniref:Uncharacterized protein n=1 Tax=Manihot esculenta TaxID=3983 RepID=A0A2C9UC20_MANES|nr:hypothetical protein MANES_16G117801v8 [Manihot esculenta]
MRRLTTIKNKSSADVELRVFAPPARPDHFRRIVRIKPGGKVNVSICEDTTGSGRLVIVMVYVDGVYSGVSLLPAYLAACSEVICDRGEDGLVHLQGIKPTLFSTCKPMFLYHLFLGMNCCGGLQQLI